jgi:hypothetical protein
VDILVKNVEVEGNSYLDSEVIDVAEMLEVDKSIPVEGRMDRNSFWDVSQNGCMYVEYIIYYMVGKRISSRGSRSVFRSVQSGD